MVKRNGQRYSNVKFPHVLLVVDCHQYCLGADFTWPLLSEFYQLPLLLSDGQNLMGLSS